ncbi:hypothetical protein [Gilvimarinus xylanilyticus]|uniref:Uncharacterized protein n=1 Tax=Gilvimarinus xylanilyticus TaxID=2944139 RepID=A0A9X2I5D6_9GAMM|nr:hypothetical protein [Gilvimarinus xylanilyticus]MCP8899222.1 hypothetical protein [Gilvimarinus xylanilyticus]
MQTNLARYLGIGRYLLVPPRAWQWFIFVGSVLVLSVCAVFQAKGADKALYHGLGFLIMAYSMGLFIVPMRMRILLSARAFMLCGDSAKMLLQIAATVLALWTLTATAFFQQQLSVEVVRIALLVSALVSLCTFFLIAFFQVAVVLTWLVFMGVSNFVSWEQVSLQISGGVSGLEVAAVVVSLCSWVAIYKFATQGRITMKPEDKLQLFRSRQTFVLFPDVRINNNSFYNFIKTVMHTNRPFSGVVLAGSAVVVAGVLLFGVLEYVNGDGSIENILHAELVTNTPVIFLIPAFIVAGLITNMCRRYRAYWLLLPDSRAQLARFMDRSIWLLSPLALLPAAVVYTFLAMVGLVPMSNVILMTVSALLIALLVCYWLFLVYGQDSMLSKLGSLVLLIVVSVYFSISSSLDGIGNPIFLLFVAISTPACLCLRYFGIKRWQSIDLTELRTRWPL